MSNNRCIGADHEISWLLSCSRSIITYVIAFSEKYHQRIADKERQDDVMLTIIRSYLFVLGHLEPNSLCTKKMCTKSQCPFNEIKLVYHFAKVTFTFQHWIDIKFVECCLKSLIYPFIIYFWSVSPKWWWKGTNNVRTSLIV